MPNPKILVLSLEASLDTNLLKLALSPWQRETHFLADPNSLSESQAATKFQSVQWVIMDEKEVSTPQKAQSLLKEQLTQAQGIYLARQVPQDKAQAQYSKIHFLQKPFNPSELNSLLENRL